MTKKTLCMIPGPVEFEERVLSSFAHAGISHVDPQVVETFGACLEKLRKVRSSPYPLYLHILWYANNLRLIITCFN